MEQKQELDSNINNFKINNGGDKWKIQKYRNQTNYTKYTDFDFTSNTQLIGINGEGNIT